MRMGHGTTGGRPPEGMKNRPVPVEASQDVYALAYLVLLTFTKVEWKSHNMWLRQVGDAGARPERAGMFAFWESRERRSF